MSPEKDVKQGQQTKWLLLLLLPSERDLGMGQSRDPAPSPENRESSQGKGVF